MSAVFYILIILYPYWLVPACLFWIGIACCLAAGQQRVLVDVPWPVQVILSAFSLSTVMGLMSVLWSYFA